MNKWLRLIVSTYLYLAFDYIFLLCHVRISEWIHALYLPECQNNSLLEKGTISEVWEIKRASKNQQLS